jgi:hypothetical protein
LSRIYINKPHASIFYGVWNIFIDCLLLRYAVFWVRNWVYNIKQIVIFLQSFSHHVVPWYAGFGVDKCITGLSSNANNMLASASGLFLLKSLASSIRMGKQSYLCSQSMITTDVKGLLLSFIIFWMLFVLSGFRLSVRPFRNYICPQLMRSREGTF